LKLFDEGERDLARRIGSLAYTNPFLPERIGAEEEILGGDFVPTAPVWSVDPARFDQNPNLAEIHSIAEGIASGARGRLSRGGERADGDDLRVYEDLALYVMFYRYEGAFYEHIVGERGGRWRVPLPRFDEFEADFEHFLGFEGVSPDLEPGHLFAIFFQLRRAFHFTFRHILGASMPSAELRASVWRSIFTRDFHRYRSGLYRRMHDIATLVIGPSGTGKDLVASAIGLSRYIPYDRGTGEFQDDFRGMYSPLDISSLSPSIVESELFGHSKGAFTGAVADRDGHLDAAEPWRTVFLDEIGDVDAAIQVKLLRVLQSREFHRLGDRVPRRFEGKIIAATNRDLAELIRAGDFRADLYYRLCSDTVETPSLATQIGGSARELERLVEVMVSRMIPGDERRDVSREAFEWIAANLGVDYGWPGNMRELSQCVNGFIVRGDYRPLGTVGSVIDEAMRGFRAGAMTADEALSKYCTMVYHRAGSFREAARILGMDRRTVKSRIDDAMLAEIRSDEGAYEG